MFSHNKKAKYEPNGGRFLQKLTAKDLYEQQIVVSVKGADSFDADDQFTANFPNIFTNYVVPSMRIESPLYQNWLHKPMKLWQTQLNFAVFCASSACGVSSDHLNYKKHILVRSVYRFHIYYQIRSVLKRLQAVLPHETNFNPADNPYTEKEFFNLCHEFEIPNDPMRYRFEKFFATYQDGSIYDDTLNANSMTRWIIQASNGFTNIGLVKISESIRAYVYLILTSQVSARANIVGNTANALTTQQAYLHNFEDIVNRRVDIQSDIKRYEDTLNYASSKVDYSVGAGLYMLPSNMNLRIKRGVSGYNNEILVSNGLVLGKNKVVNLPVKFKNNSIETHHAVSSLPQRHETKAKANSSAITSDNKQRSPPLTHKNKHEKITHEEEKIALVIAIVCVFTAWRLLL